MGYSGGRRDHNMQKPVICYFRSGFTTISIITDNGRKKIGGKGLLPAFGAYENGITMKFLISASLISIRIEQQ